MRPGDLVAVSMPNQAWWPVVALGVWRAGAAVSPLSPLWTADESARVLARAVPRAAIAFAPFAATVRAALATAGLRDVDLAVLGGDAAGATPIEALLALGAGDAYAEPDVQPDDLAAVPFSSGTGGLPKGVRITHGNLAAAAAQGAEAFRAAGAFDERSVVLAGAPFFHAIGLVLMLSAPLSVGAGIVTLPRPVLEPLLELVAAHRVTHVAVPPPLFDALAADPRVDEHDLGSLRLVISGGAHIGPDVERTISERLGCVARQGYGATEATCTISAPLGRPSTPGTAGWLVPGTEARLIDPATGADVDPGEPGELWVRGPQVMEGYHGRPQDTAAAITSDGWLRTGDLVAIRDDGQLEIRDRLKELIKVRGASVAPAEIELVLRQHPAVRDAGVVGIPDASAARRRSRSSSSSRAQPDELGASPPNAWPATSVRARSSWSTRSRACRRARSCAASCASARSRWSDRTEESGRGRTEPLPRRPPSPVPSPRPTRRAARRSRRACPPARPG